VVSHRNFVIVGAGQAGARAAQGMRDNGFDGGIVMIGEETALPYERPPLSKATLLDPDETEARLIFDRDYYNTRGVETRLGIKVLSIDRQAQIVYCNNGESVHYDKLLIATGGRLRRLSVRNSEHPDIFYLRTHSQALLLSQQLKPSKRVVILGGGFIGLEVAAAAVQRGCAVSVLELGPQLLGRFAPKVVAEAVGRIHQRNGVTMATSATIRGLERTNSPSPAWRIAVEGGRELEADVLVVGIGIEPETTLATQAGLRVDNGILVDAFGQTSDPLVFAAGDVACQFHPLYQRHVRLECWQGAQDQGLTVGRVMAHGPSPAPLPPPWAWSDQFDLNIQVAGLCSGSSPVIIRGDPNTDSFTAFNAHEGIIVGAISLNRGRDMPYIKRLISAKHLVDSASLGDEEMPLKAFLRAAA
jgi:NADPH-dependent 2,4-dienoyl-CoA reductase/sulfur reductase-like enzyme